MLQRGDIVLVEGNDLLGWFVKLGNLWTRLLGNKKGINYTHTAMMYTSNDIVEALSSGVTLRPFPYKNCYSVWRKKGITVPEQTLLRTRADQYLGQKYSWWLLFCIGVLKILRLEWMFKGIGHRGKICSVFVAQCFDAINYRFSNIEEIDLMDPADIANHVMNSYEWEQVA